MCTVGFCVQSRSCGDIALPSRLFETLRYLIEHAGEPIDKATLMKAV